MFEGLKREHTNPTVVVLCNDRLLTSSADELNTEERKDDENINHDESQYTVNGPNGSYRGTVETLVFY